MSLLQMFLCIIFTFAFYEVKGSNANDVLRILKVQMSGARGAGMDGGTMGFLFLNGGKFKIKLCPSFSSLNNQCCETNWLNTDDDNWERGEINFFVGHQLGACQNFPISDSPIRATLKHKGNDGGHIFNFVLSGSFPSKVQQTCLVNEKLDGRSEKTVTCILERRFSEGSECNGHSSFCTLSFDQFTFAGSHNAGTGMGSAGTRAFNCALKNHDLTITEQLDLGLRFLDFDVIFNPHIPSCDGLETGHGMFPDFAIYRCFGLVSSAFQEISTWLINHPTDVVVLHFGELQHHDTTYGHLAAALKRHFDPTEIFTRTQALAPKLNNILKGLVIGQL